MKLKFILLALGLLTVCTARSQGITGSEVDSLGLDTRPISFPFWMAREIALDLSEKEHHQKLLELTHQENAILKSLLAGKEEQYRSRSLQVVSLENQNQTLQLSLKAVKLKKSRAPLWKRGLQLVGALGIGYMIGSSNR